MTVRELSAHVQLVMSSDFATRIAEAKAGTEALLDRLLTPLPGDPGADPPPRLIAAMRHAALGGGKRLRPFLVIETARLFGTQGDGVLRAAAALECVHCYSLVHDDLPAMDDDDLRRGQPTVHRAYDEATAILAGDALLTLAFAVVADPATHDDPAVRSALTASLAAAAGAGGMVGGQMIDLAAENRSLSDDAIRAMQAMKTGALFRCACEAGAIAARADAADRTRIAEFGARLGLAFQVADDLIDATASTEAAGKKTAKDFGRGKATLVALHGIEGARTILRDAIGESITLLEPFGEQAAVLRQAAASLGDD